LAQELRSGNLEFRMLSIVIVNWNTRDQLEFSLKSLHKYPAKLGQSIIAVDNASSDGSAAMVRQQFPTVTLIEPGINTGYAAGNNLGFAVCTTEAILTLNPDTEVLDGTLDRAFIAFDAQPTAGAVAARLVGHDGQTQASVRGFPTYRGVLGDALGIAARRPGSAWDAYRRHDLNYTVAQWVPQPMGTFLLFRRSALAKVGNPAAPFDPQFPIFFNEVDLLWRLAQVGHPCWYDPSVVVRHLGGASTRQVRPRMIWESHRSLARYWAKHPPSPQSRWFHPGIKALLYVGAFIRARGYHAGF